MTVDNGPHRGTQQLSLRGSGDVETAFVLDVEHQITSIQVLHDKEEMLLCKRGQGGTTSWGHLSGVFNAAIPLAACTHFRLEGGIEMCEERVLPGKGQHSFLHHGALHIIIHQDHILLQDLYSKELSLPLQLSQQHLKSQQTFVFSYQKAAFQPRSETCNIGYYPGFY